MAVDPVCCNLVFSFTSDNPASAEQIQQKHFHIYVSPACILCTAFISVFTARDLTIMH